MTRVGRIGFARKQVDRNRVAGEGIHRKEIETFIGHAFQRQCAPPP